MKFPGKRKTKHYFPVDERKREAFERSDSYLRTNAHVVGICQLLVDIEANVSDDYLASLKIGKGQSVILEDQRAEDIYRYLKNNRALKGEFAGGTVGNTLHNYCILADGPAVLLGAIGENIHVGDYAFKYICNTSSRIDLSYLKPCTRSIGRAICFITPDGERTFAISKGCMDDFGPDSIPENVLANASILLISAYLLRDENSLIGQATIKACQLAKKNNIPVVMGLGTSGLIKEKRDFFLGFIKDYVSVVAMNEKEAEALSNLSHPMETLNYLLDFTDLVLITIGPKGLYMGGHIEKSLARKTKNDLKTDHIKNYNEFEYSRGMRRADCKNSQKVFTHYAPYLGGPEIIKNTNGAGDAALAAVIHDMVANRYHRLKVPSSPKHIHQFLTYSSLSQICKYANRVSYEVLVQNSPRLFKGLPESDDDLDKIYWES